MPLNEENSIEYWGNSNPKCPHCDDIIDIGDNDMYFLYNTDEDFHEIECPSCKKQLTVTSNCTWSFNTDEQDF